MDSDCRHNWQLRRLEEICVQITDGKHGDCQDEPDSGFYFLSCKDVVNGKLNYEGARQITESDFLDTHRRTKFDPADVLITNSGTIGRMALAPDNALTRRTTFQKSVAILKPKNSHVEPSFLYYVILSDIRRLTEFAGGTAQKNLLLRDLRSFEVRIPPLPTQQRISNILSAYDELIENSQRRIKILESMARILYREWFVHFRFPGHESIPLVPSALGDIPEGWEVRELRDLFEFVGGSQPPKSEHAYEERAGYVRFIQNRDYGSSSHLTYIADSSRNKFCDPLDIMMDKYGEPGRTRFGLAGAYNVALAKIRPHEAFHREWLRGLISEPDFNTYLAGASMAATRASVNSSHFILPVAVPPAVVAKSFVEHVEPLIRLNLSHRASIANLRQTRDVLLQRLLSGQIEVEATAP